MMISAEAKEPNFKPIEIKILIETKEELDILDLYFNIDSSVQVSLVNDRLNEATKKNANTIKSTLNRIYEVIQNIKSK